MIIMTFPHEESLLLSPFHPKFKNKHPVQSLATDNVGAKDVDNSENSSKQSSNEVIKSVEQKETTQRKRFPALGIIMALMSVLCYSIGSAIVNLLPELHSIEILVVRALFQFITFSTITITNQYNIIPEKGHRLDLILRCIAGTVTLTTVFVAYRLMPLADASTIQFSSPVFVAIFGYFILKEAISWLQGIAGILTLAGVVVIAQPEFIFGAQSDTIYDERMLGTVLAVVSSLSGALSMIALRRLKTTPVAVIVMWFSGLVIVVGLIMLMVLNALVWPQGLYTWALLAAVGLCGVGDQYFVSMAMRFESAGPVSVTRTLTIVMTFIWEALLLGQAIEWMSVIGASIITFCIVMLAMDKWRKESPQTFDNLCFCCDTSDDYTDETTKLKLDFSDSFDGFYDSIDYKKQSNNQIYFNQFILIDGTNNEQQSNDLENNK